MRKGSLLAIGSVFAAVSLTAAPSYGDDYRCKGDVEGGYFDNVYVPKGEKCRLLDTEVEGNIFVRKNGALKTVGVHVKGNIQSYRARWVRINKTYVGGDVQIEGTKRKASRVKKSRVYGNIQVEKNFVPFTIYGNRVGGDVQFNHNEDIEFVIAKNRIKGNLQCFENDPKPEGGSNKVYGDAQGQCYDLTDYDDSFEDE